MPGELKTLQDVITCQRHSMPAAAEPGLWSSVVLQQHPQAASIGMFPTSRSLLSSALYFSVKRSTQQKEYPLRDLNPEEQ